MVRRAAHRPAGAPPRAAAIALAAAVAAACARPGSALHSAGNMLMDLPYATFYPAEKTPENPKGYIDGEFHVFWKDCFSMDCTSPTLGVFPGMRIVFSWNGPHNVLAMGDNKAAYNSCDKSAGTNLGPSEATYLVPDKVGEDLYFICGIGSHCSSKDMKVKFHIHALPEEFYPSPSPPPPPPAPPAPEATFACYRWKAKREQTNGLLPVSLKKKAVGGKNPTGSECAEAAKEAGYSFAGIVRLKAKRAKCYAGDLDPADFSWPGKGNFGPLADDRCDADGTLGAKKVVTVYDVTGDYR